MSRQLDCASPFQLRATPSRVTRCFTRATRHYRVIKGLRNQFVFSEIYEQYTDMHIFISWNRPLRFISTLLLLFLIVFEQLPAEELNEAPELHPIFDEMAAQGTFLLYDLTEARFRVHDVLRAQTRYIPASTFKIANTLIGLEAGSVRSVDEVLPYGGEPQPYQSWEHDMGLRDAIKISNVPIYQELARRTGLAILRAWMDRLDYGNRQIGVTVDRFWLDGPLKISALEQVRFLARLAKGELPATKSSLDATREILLIDQGDDWRLYAKTGLRRDSDPGIGWWVGWVEKEGRIYTFALNIDIRNPQDVDNRIPLGMACLRRLGVLPTPAPSASAL